MSGEWIEGGGHQLQSVVDQGLSHLMWEFGLRRPAGFEPCERASV